ncbi:kinase-like protein [Terfezia boudieri ATCC MYA-4762]|uniref:Kinase-like protein n=1 Tax=Terfezia boudieri ATCC MYA-4762 TaxID=1051890 RepID=A0A3N4LKV1_9PEZI|nr:kinase-like protein [Terfezia boudieri ATCC MYA-4762]
MDPWNNAPYSSDPPANRQPRYGSNVLQNSASTITQTRDFNLPQQPQHQPQQSSSYQAYHGSSSVQTGPSSAVATPNTSRADSSADYMDIDSENYSRSKYSQSQSREQGSRQPYLQSEDPSTLSQRYSPLNSLSPQTQYISGSNTLSQQMPSNYQARQSPSRPNYTNLTQSYYNQSTGSPRTSGPPTMQTYNHPLQPQQAIPQQPPNISRQSSMSNAPQLPPIGVQNSGDGNNSRYFPPSATIQQASFDHGQPSPRPGQQPTPQMEPVPQFSRVTSANDLQPRVHAQPAYRRANPDDGGFISPLQALTTYLPVTYRFCNNNFKYESSRNPRRVLTKPSKGVKNDGYDNEDSDYILYVNDILGSEENGHKNRYLILDVLGQGTFGQVVKCQNLKTQEVVAVKVVKNRTAYFNQSMMEVSVLDLLNSKLDKGDDNHILRLKDTFIHRQHLCLVFELLSVNLYELIKQNQFRGLSTTLVRVFAQQLLTALCLLNKAKLIHCDLKPENILLKNLESPIIKVIDFGSACDERQTVYTYIQSRFYRSPEVLLGLPYSSSIDMWSLGCIVVELFLGLPLFPGSSEYNQVARITEMLGVPPTWMIEVGKQGHDYFEKVVDEFGRKSYKLKSMEKYAHEHGTKEQPSKKYFQATTLPDIIRQYAMPRKNMKPVEIEREMNNRVAFIDFVRGLLTLNPLERWSPQQAKMHPFITNQKFTGPFHPPMNLKSPNPKSPAPGTQQQQQAAQKHQEQEQMKQRQAQAQVQAQAQAQQVAQAAQVSCYSNVSMGSYGSQPPVYNNMYNPPSHPQQQPQQQQQQQPAPPPYTNSLANQYGNQGNMIAQQPNQIQSNPYPHQMSYHNSTARAARQRAATNIEGIPPQIQRAASMIDPTQPIRSQPSPAYFPPPPDAEGGSIASGIRGNRNKSGRGGYGRGGNRDVIRTLEDRTLEDGLFSQQHYH